MKRALMLGREDPVIQKIFDECIADQKAANERLKEIEKQIQQIHEAHAKFRADAFDRVEARVREMGIAFNKKKHELSIHPPEGVVWLESKEDSNCGCPLCRLGMSGFFGGGR